MDPARLERRRNRRLLATAYLLGLLIVSFLIWSKYSQSKSGATSTGKDASPAAASNDTAVQESSHREEPLRGAPATAGSSNLNSNKAPGGVAAVDLAAQTPAQSEEKPAGPTKETQIQRGRAVYRMFCFGCHQWEGQGIPGQVPPLANADFLMANTEDSIRGLLVGRSEEIVVNGATYKGIMLPMNYLTDDNIADVMTYALNSWGNSGTVVAADTVARIRRESPPPPHPAEGTSQPPKLLPGGGPR